MRRSIVWLVLAASVVSSFAACLPTYAAVGYTTWVDMPPPNPYVEVAPSAPGPNYVWVNGYWNWNGVQWQWVRGYWAPIPVAGYTWQPSGWVFVDGRYGFVAGRWVTPHHHPPVHYVHPVPRVRVEGHTGTHYHTVPYHGGGHRGGGHGRHH